MLCDFEHAEVVRDPHRAIAWPTRGKSENWDGRMGFVKIYQVKQKLFALILAMLTLTLLDGAARAQINMPIVGPQSGGFPIAVSPLKNLSGDESNQISASFNTILTRDLKLSGYFHLIDPASFIENAQTSGYDVGQINFNDWKSIGADFLVKGAVTHSGSNVEVEALLFDVANQRRLTGKKFDGSPGDVGEMARRFADEIMRSVTGTRGPFDSKIAFVSTAGGRYKEIFTAWMDGGSLFRVTDNPTINLFPSFDRGARHLLYLSYKTMTPDLYLVDLNQQVETRIDPGVGQAVGGTLTPGGNIVGAYERGGNTNLYLLDSSGGQLNAITNNQAINVSPSVCADGSRVAYTSDRSGTPQIYVGSVNGGGAQRITYQGSYNTAPAFSPDCKKIAYESREGAIFQIYVVDAGGGDPKELTQSGSNESPTWSPDGRYIIFARKGGARSKLYLMRVEDGGISLLMEGEGNDSNPSWSGWMGE
jgi:TolB protein